MANYKWDFINKFKYTTDAEGEYHSYNDLPAIEYFDGSGTQIWMYHGLVHRDEDKGPAFITQDKKEYYKNGKLHSFNYYSYNNLNFINGNICKKKEHDNYVYYDNRVFLANIFIIDENNIVIYDKETHKTYDTNSYKDIEKLEYKKLSEIISIKYSENIVLNANKLKICYNCNDNYFSKKHNYFFINNLNFVYCNKCNIFCDMNIYLNDYLIVSEFVRDDMISYNEYNYKDYYYFNNKIYSCANSSIYEFKNKDKIIVYENKTYNLNNINYYKNIKLSCNNDNLLILKNIKCMCEYNINFTDFLIENNKFVIKKRKKVKPINVWNNSKQKNFNNNINFEIMNYNIYYFKIEKDNKIEYKLICPECSELIDIKDKVLT
jgi:hypothetical protein